MRKLMWFTIGFGAAIALAAYLYFDRWLILLAFLLLLPLFICLFLKRKGSKILAVILLGSITGLLYYSVFDGVILSPIQALDDTTQYVTLEATDHSFDTGYGSAVDCTLKRQNREYSLRLYYTDSVSVKPGDTIKGMVWLRYTPAGGTRASTYHKGDGIYLLAYAKQTMEFTAAESLPSRYFAAQLRNSISQRISEIFPGDTGAFAKALLLGDDNEIAFDEDLSYQKSGIRHVIAVSGLHVSMLFSLVYILSGKRTILTLLVGYPVLLVFCAVAGFTPSVVRACIMQALMMLSMAVRKEYDHGTSLAFASLVILAVNPLAITSVSFQLSVGSMIGIFLFSHPISQYLLSRKGIKKYNNVKFPGRLLRFVINSVSVTVSAMTATLPLCAMYFGMISAVSIVTNLATLWIVSFVFCGMIAACLLSVLWMPAGIVTAAVISWAIRYIQFMARVLSGIPGGVAYTDSPYTVLWIISTLGLILLFFLSKRKSPMLLTTAVCVLYFLSLFLTWLEPRMDSVHVTVLDVGQGQCVLLQSKETAYLLDCGGENPRFTAETVIQAMGAQGIYQLDGIILTHYDKDHANAATLLLQTVPVACLYLPDTEPDNSIRRELEKQAVSISWIRHIQSLSCDTGEITVYPAKTGTQGNESSMCILYQGEKCAILVTGDRDTEGEKDLLDQGTIPKLDLLVVGHHGANSSTGWELLAQTKPDVAVISVGEDNLHDHPNVLTLDRLARFGCIIRRTDEEGTIHFRG